MQGNFIKRKTRDLYLTDTGVENLFIGEYMAKAPSDYVKVYLYGLMYASSEEYMDNQEIGKQLSLAPEDVLKAWSYWADMGVIKKHFDNPQDSYNYTVEFLSLRENLYGSGSSSRKAKKDGREKSALGNPELKEIYQGMEKILGRPLGGKESETILSFMDDYGAGKVVILEAATYCKETRKKDSISYIGKVVKDWAAKGFSTREQILEHLEQVDNRHYLYKRVMKALGFTRNATEAECKIMDRWFDEMNCSIELVLEACGKTSGISNPNINYINKVLENWQKEGSSAGGSRSEGGAGGSGSQSQGVSVAVVNRYYDYLRAQAEGQALERRKEVYEKVPLVKDLENTARELGTKTARILTSGASDAREQMAKLKNEIAAIEGEKLYLLTENGFAPDYMEVKYSCSACKDTGVNEMGERCACFVERRREAELWEKGKAVQEE